MHSFDKSEILHIKAFDQNVQTSQHYLFLRHYAWKVLNQYIWNIRNKLGQMQSGLYKEIRYLIIENYIIMDVMSGIEDITTKYDEFINTIDTQLPKVSKSLIFELMPILKEEKESPGYNLQIHIKDNANKDELKNVILKEWGVVPAFYEHNHAVVEHRVDLQLLKQLNDLDSVDSIIGSRSGGGRASTGPVLERDDDHPEK